MRDLVGGRHAAVLVATSWVLASGCGSSSPGTHVDGGLEAASTDVARADAHDGAPAAADAIADGAPPEAPSADVLAKPDAAPDAARDLPAADVAAEASVDVAAEAASDAPAASDGAGADGPISAFASLRWVALPAPAGAFMTAIAVDGDGVLYAGSGGGLSPSLDPSAGIFKSTDHGATWHPANFGIYDFHVGSLLALGATVYAGTAGLLRSTDGAASWQQVTSPASVGLISSIGAAANLVVAGSDYGGNPIYLSSDGGKTFNSAGYSSLIGSSIAVVGSVVLIAGPDGMLRSSDGGVTFNAPQGIVNGSGMDAQVACDGVSTCYANAHDSTTLGPAVLLKSTDVGASWVPVGPANAQVLAVSDSGAVYVTSSSVIARSDNGGQSFEMINRPTTTVAFQPNCNGPYAARGDEIFAACPNGVYRSADKGRHWQAASGSVWGSITGSAAMTLVDNGATALGPSGDIYVVASDTTAFSLRRSSDGGWTWQTVAPGFYATSCIVTGAGALECVQFNTGTSATSIARSEDHGLTWTTVSLPAGTPASTPGTPPVIKGGAGGAGAAVYVISGGAALRSDDDGRSFHLLGGPALGPVQVLRNGHLLGSGTAGTSTTYRSRDQGVSWQPLPRAFRLPVLDDGSGRLLLVEGGGTIAASTDEGDSWPYLVTNGLPYFSGNPGAFAADGAGRLFLIAPGPTSSPAYGRPLQLYASADGGLTWEPMPAPIPNPNVNAFATDKQGRLLASTTGGVFRLESTADPGPSPPDGGAGGPDGGAGAPTPRPLSMVVQNAPWSLPLPAGFTVDAAQRVYVSDENNVYVIDGGVLGTYLTRAEAVSAAGLGYLSFFLDVAAGPDGLLYVMGAGGLVGSSSSTTVALRSGAAHQAALWRDLATLTATRMEVIAAGRVGFLDTNGFSTATASAMQLVYPAAALQQTSGCVIPDLAATPSGALALLPGCIGRPVLRGTVDGAPPSVLYQPSTDPLRGERFGCTAADPAGGFYFMVSDTLGANPRLYHVAEGASGAGALVHVVTDPSFGDVSVARGGSEFSGCKMAAAPNGVLYVQTLQEVWKVGL